MTDSEARKSRVVEFLREVWSQGDAEAAAKYLAPTYTIEHDPGDPWDGRELDLAAFRDRVRRSRAPFPDQRFEVVKLYADGDTVVVSWRWRGTHTGDLPGFPASGRSIATSGMTAYSFTGDRIRGHWQVTDRLSVFQQLRPTPAAQPTPPPAAG